MTLTLVVVEISINTLWTGRREVRYAQQWLGYRSLKTDKCT